MDAFFQSVAQAFGGNRAALPGVELAILALLALAVLLQLGRLARALLARRSRFHRLLQARGVAREDVRFAAALAARAALEPAALVSSLEHFERATALALAPGSATLEADAAAIRRLRHALGYDRLPPHAPLLSTRELAPGTAVDVAGQPGAVAAVDELGFTVEVREPPAAAAGGQLSLALTHAREARYALGCRLARAHPQPGGDWHLELLHDEHPARQQQRAYVRVPVEGPVALAPVAPWQPGLTALAAPVQARLVDLSGGGLAAEARAALPVGTLVRASFTVDGAVFDGLRAVVLACQRGAGGRHRLHLEFTGRPGAERERLVGALTHLELRAQAEAAERAAGSR